MKKALIIATAMVLSLSACTSQPVTESTAATSAPTSSASSEQSSTAPDDVVETQEESSEAPIAAPTAAPKVEAKIANPSEITKLLTYLIEEEKLAHDVYTVMYDSWGAKVFGNILQSEQSHQSQVFTVMQSRNIADPRVEELGVFKNVELQKLYDQLVAKGTKSSTDAIEVGIAIEELDIADITDMLAVAKDADVIAALENLRRGSENHLRAFNRQL